MKITSIHLGPIDPVRQSCLDRQRVIYEGIEGIEYNLITEKSYTSFSEDKRESTDPGRLVAIRSGGGYLDSDSFPIGIWLPPSPGIWLFGNWGRPDYCVMFNEKCNEYIENMIDFYYTKNPKFPWVMEYFAIHSSEINLIPMGVFEHLGLTTRKGIV